MRNTLEIQLAPEDEHLARLIREGKCNAEIAVRLGVSNAQVAERIERLRRGLRDAEDGPCGGDAAPFATAPEIRAEPTRRQRHQGFGMLWTFVLGLVLGVGATQIATDGGAPSNAGPTPDDVEAAVPGSNGPVDGGLVFAVPGQGRAVAAVEVRGAVNLVELSGAGFARFGEGGVAWNLMSRRAIPESYTFAEQSPRGPVQLHVMAATPDTKLLPDERGALAVFSASGAPRLLLWVDGFASSVSEDGRLRIADEPLPADAAIAYDTGELLDASRMVQVGTAGTWSGTMCGAAGACTVIAGPGSGLAAWGSSVDCEGGTVRVLGEGRELAFVPLEPAGCDDGSLLAAGAHYRVSATNEAGEALSVVARVDGALLVGDVTRAFACPCRQGS